MDEEKQPYATDPALRAVQLKQLELLDLFDGFCTQNSLKYFFCGGALIGAVRHKGFVPWDDDIDVWMFRSDYEKLPGLFENYPHDPKYSLEKTTRDFYADTMLTQLSDSSTTFIKSSQADKDVNHGVRLEIIPLDAGREGLARKLQLFWAVVFVLFNRRYIPTSKGKAASAVARALLWLVRGEKARTAIWRFAERRMSARPIGPDTKCLTELTVDFRYVKNLYPVRIFESAVMLDFESRKIPAPVGYDEYLHMAFGDYMTPPPPEKRNSGHDPVFMDAAVPFVAFRGIKYLVEPDVPKTQKNS